VVQRLLQLEVVAAAVFQRLAVFLQRDDAQLFFQFVALGLFAFLLAVVARCLSGRLRGARSVQAVAVGVFIHGTSGVMPLAWIERPFGV
jgi:hypothetical protein